MTNWSIILWLALGALSTPGAVAPLTKLNR